MTRQQGFHLKGEPVLAGAAEGRLLRLTRPISFWGGVDPATGRIADPRHPQHDCRLDGRVVALPATIGSSSSSAILLELIAAGRAPAALLLGEIDAILSLGAVAGRELGYATVPVVRLDPADIAALPREAHCRVAADGTVEIVPGPCPTAKEGPSE